MEYLQLMKQSLDSFTQNLAKDEMRVNGLKNDAKRLQENKDKLKEEVESLIGKKEEFLIYTNTMRETQESEIAKKSEKANDLMAKANELFETAKRERSQAKAVLSEAERESGKVNSLREVWDKKTKDLAAVIGN